MFRLDAQHAYALPGQNPDWYGKILVRNKFAGSIYVPRVGSIADAIALAARHSYIQRIVPRLHPDQINLVPDHPLIVSVQLSSPSSDALTECARRGLSVECDASHWPLDCPVPIALIGMPAEPVALPAHVFIKLTGMRLPATPEQAARLHTLLRHPGPERLMFASDWPHGGGTWKEILAAFTQSLGAMPIPLREQLLGATAREFYRL